MPVRVAVDTAGREPGCRTVLEGVIAAQEEAGAQGVIFHPVLYGSSDVIRETLREITGSVKAEDDYIIRHSPETIEMNEEASEALRSKPNSSILCGIKDLAAGAIDAFVSLGNTGAVVGGSRAVLKQMRWIGKPALAVPIPKKGGGWSVLLDIGASPDPKPGHLLQFAAMGSVYIERLHRVKNPRVGLLNIGSESHKGDERARDTHKLLQRSPLNFIGNIEGSDIFHDKADVIVTTGFVGNILLKFIESIPSFFEGMRSSDGSMSAGAETLSQFDYRRYGGACLLGVDGTVIIGHGKSSPEAVAGALRLARTLVSRDMLGVLREQVFKTRRAVWLSNPFSRGDGLDD
ncbi:phosphate acyltransferase [bacterium BMS3Bbin04]|nr:phosphate acyltransferase [bacterium BMS3Bbin04]